MKNINLCKYIYTCLNVSSFNDLKTYVNTFTEHNVYKKNDEKYAYIKQRKALNDDWN